LTLVLNGKLYQQSSKASVSPHDRGLMYGHSVFETMAVTKHTPLLLDQHITRLELGAERLHIPLDSDAIIDDINRLCELQSRAVIRAMVSMGEGGRGYQNPPQPKSLRIVSLHDYPKHPAEYWQHGIHLGVSDIKLGLQPALAGIKHGNRLEQILARNAWQNDWHEALLLDQANRVIEATQGNIFVLKNDTLCTPILDQAGVAGVMREYVLSVANKVGVDPQVVSLSESDVEAADAVFVTNSVIGLWPVKQFKARQFNDLSFAHKLLNLMVKNGAIPNF